LCSHSQEDTRHSLKLRGKIVTTEPKESGRGEKNSFDQESWKTTVSKRREVFLQPEAPHFPGRIE